MPAVSPLSYTHIACYFICREVLSLQFQSDCSNFSFVSSHVQILLKDYLSFSLQSKKKPHQLSLNANGSSTYHWINHCAQCNDVFSLFIFQLHGSLQNWVWKQPKAHSLKNGWFLHCKIRMVLLVNSRKKIRAKRQIHGAKYICLFIHSKILVKQLLYTRYYIRFQW